MKNLICSFILLTIVNYCSSQNDTVATKLILNKAQVSYSDFEELVTIVKEIRSERLIDFNELLEFQKDKKTIILDTRSKEMYEGKHIKGAINLPFTEFTQDNLQRIIPDVSTRIIIYCNNNFTGDRKFFASKLAKITPEMINAKKSKKKIKKNNNKLSHKPRSLALNIPTYINLFGYGYRNIYELNESVAINDSRLKLKGNSVDKKSKK